jgi:signal transduction histidine kinase
MLVSRGRLDGPRRLIASFVLLLLLPAAAVVWMGVRLIGQDRALESQLRDRRENAADRLVVGLEKAISASEQKSTAPPDEDSLLAVIDSATVEAYPKGRLLYYPASPVFTEAPEFAPGEILEFQARNYGGAAAAFRKLAGSSTAEVRAGALLRLARNLRHIGSLDEALRVYRDLARMPDVRVDGVPADLAARRARCAVLEDLGRTEALRDEARSLQADLFAARWRLDRGTFFNYAAELEGWLGTGRPLPAGREALAEAVEWLWRNPLPGRRSVQFAGINLTLLPRQDGERTVALVAGPAFQQREWFALFQTQIDAREVHAALAASDGTAVVGALPADFSFTARRSLADTQLPWNVYVSNADAAADLKALTLRSRMTLAGLAAVVLLIFGGGYFAIRAVSREFAVARLQSDFVSTVSHEFRTPLTSLRQFTELLKDDEDLPAEKRRVFHQAQARATERLHRLVESLLDFRRMEAGARPYRRQTLPAAPLVRAVVEDFQREAPQGFTIESSIAEDTGTVEADPEALGRALWNLLEDDFPPPGGSWSTTSPVYRAALAAPPDDEPVTGADAAAIARAIAKRRYGYFMR